MAAETAPELAWWKCPPVHSSAVTKNVVPISALDFSRRSNVGQVVRAEVTLSGLGPTACPVQTTWRSVVRLVFADSPSSWSRRLMLSVHVHVEHPLRVPCASLHLSSTPTVHGRKCTPSGLVDSAWWS